MFQRTAFAAGVLLGAVVLGACSNSSLFGPPQAWPGTAWTRYGHQVPYSVVDAAAGPSHCGWESATFLTVGWPLGTSAQHASHARQYIRDATKVVPRSHLRSKFAVDVRLPTDARNTGYRDGNVQLYLAPSDEDRAIYVVAAGRIERWPRSDPMTTCS